VTPDRKLIEIGIGPMIVIAKEIGGSNVIGIDINDWQRPLCEEFDIQFKICDIQNSELPLENESADIILLLEVIEHLCMYPNDLFEKIYSKIRKGGYLFVSSVNFLRISNRIRMLMGKSPLVNRFEKTVDGRNHIREFYPDELEYYLMKSGFEVFDQYQFGVPDGNRLVASCLKLAYVYPAFRNYFLISCRKPNDSAP
jgi:2-polyprenyl-3-methyl-5-hydroxy-6-metoxy-1,4-benzoquinol methylase